MRSHLLVSVLMLYIWSTTAGCSATVRPQSPGAISATPTSASLERRAAAQSTATKSKSTSSPTKTKHPKAKQTGLTKATKIGIGIGIPLGVLSIGAAIGCYIFGRRRGRKRRVDDPTAGAGKKIQDPSPELNLPPPAPIPPPIPELSTVRSDDLNGAPISGYQNSWWKPFLQSPAKRDQYVALQQSSQSPQELPT